MLGSPLLSNNPNLYVFLPMLYTVWSDAVLTPTEIATVKELISNQHWLSEEERSMLESQLSPQNPPSPGQLKDWLDEIRKVSPAASDSLVEIGIKLAALHANGRGTDALNKAKHTLTGIEETLGVLSRESAFSFYPEGRSTESARQETQYTFDIATMTATLDGRHGALIGKVKKIISDPVFKYYPPDDIKAYREKVLEWSRHLAAQGFGAMAYPRAYGGQDDMAAYFTVMETLSYHDLSLVVKFGVQFGLFGMSILFLGTEKHHKQYLKDAGTLTLPGCFAMTETGHGSNVRGVETTATYNHANNTFEVHTPHEQARKEYIGNAAAHGRMATVFAKLVVGEKDYGVAAFLVPIRDEKGKTVAGITIKDCGRKMGLNGVDNGVIYFDHVVIPRDNMLDRFAQLNDAGEFESPISSDNRRFFTMLGTLVGGRIGIPRSGLSAAKSGLTIAIRYGDKRRQFGPEGSFELPILNYRTHQRRLMPLLANAYALHFALQYVTERFLSRTEEEMQEIEALAAGLKAFATWNTTATLQECRECCGGKAYLSENRIDILKADTDVYTTFEGDNTVLMQLVAKGRLTEFKQEFSNMNFFSIVNYVASQARTAIQEMNPFTIRNTDEDHLLDPEFHLNAFSYRERDILTSAARRIKKHLDNGMDSFDALNQTQHHLVNVAHAYVERVVLEQFQVAVEKQKDEGCKAALRKLCRLFALSQIEKNKGWYLEHGYLEGVKTKAIRRMVTRLCWEIRQEAIPLTDAFAIPDKCLSAPIALKERQITA